MGFCHLAAARARKLARSVYSRGGRRNGREECRRFTAYGRVRDARESQFQCIYPVCGSVSVSSKRSVSSTWNPARNSKEFGNLEIASYPPRSAPIQLAAWQVILQSSERWPHRGESKHLPENRPRN